MKIFRKLTLRTLLKNRTRTAVTIIGVILSAAMITAVTTLVSSTRNYATESVRHSTGDWHGVYYAADNTAASALTGTGQVKDSDIMTAQILGYAQLDGISNPAKPYLYVLGADTQFYADMAVYLTSGRLPQNPAEILLPDHLASNGGLQLKTGEVLTLSLGRRLDSSGAELLQTQPLSAVYDSTTVEQVTETLSVTETRYYTVVGFYERPNWEGYSAPGYTALTVPDDTAPADCRYDVYFRLAQPTKALDFMQTPRSFTYGDWDKNTDLLMFYGVSAYTGFMSILGGFAAILIALIMFGSISLIYNAFSISVSQRTKQFGLLSSVGATKKQLRASVRYEALMVSVIGIPLGVLCGIFGIWVTLQLIGSKFSSFFYGDTHISGLSLYVSPMAVILAVIVAFITVLISAHVPARRAMRVTAIEAIRQTQDVTIKARAVKTSKLTQKLFGLEGTLARKNFKRSKKSYRATVVSLFMSIVLFISAGSFCAYLKLSVGGVMGGSGYDIRYYCVPGDVASEETDDTDGTFLDNDQVFDLLTSVEGVERATRFYTENVILNIPAEQLSNRFVSLLDATNKDIENVPAYLVIVDDASYRVYLEEQGLSAETYFNTASPKAIAVQNMSYLGAGRYENYDILKKAEPGPLPIRIFNSGAYNLLTDQKRDSLTEAERATYWTDLTLDVGLYTDELAYGTNEFVGYGINIMIPQSVAEAVLDGIWNCADEQENFRFAAPDHSAVYSRMLQVLEENNLPTWRLYDQADNEQSMRDIVTIINVFSYGFIVLISLIALANVFNTISTNISLRRREFAMLRSVGITRRGMNRMMNYECLMYGFKGLLYGLPVSICITYLMFRSATSGYEQSFFIPPVPVIIAVCSVFIVVFATMLYAMRKIKKDNPIDALRSENI